MSKPMSDELTALLRKVRERVSKMSQEQIDAIIEEQRRSFVFGSYNLSHPNSPVTREYVDHIADAYARKVSNELQEKKD